MRRQERLDQQSILPVQILAFWFVGYAHRDDKSDIAIAVIVEKQVSEVNMPCRLQKEVLMHIIMNEMLHVLLKSIILINMTVL